MVASNVPFLVHMKLTLDEVRGKKPGEVLQGKHTDPEAKRRIRQKLDSRQPFYEEILKRINAESPEV